MQSDSLLSHVGIDYLQGLTDPFASVHASIQIRTCCQNSSVSLVNPTQVSYCLAIPEELSIALALRILMMARLCSSNSVERTFGEAADELYESDDLNDMMSLVVHRVRGRVVISEAAMRMTSAARRTSRYMVQKSLDIATAIRLSDSVS